MTNKMQTTKTSLIMGASATVGMAGAIAGGAMAAAKGINDVRKDKITKEAAAANVLKESAGMGLASGVATAVLGVSGISNFVLGILAFTGTAVGTKYLWDNLVLPNKNNHESLRMTSVEQPETDEVEPEPAQQAERKTEPETTSRPCADKKDEVKDSAETKEVPESKTKETPESSKTVKK